MIEALCKDELDFLQAAALDFRLTRPLSTPSHLQEQFSICPTMVNENPSDASLSLRWPTL